MSSSYRCTSY